MHDIHNICCPHRNNPYANCTCDEQRMAAHTEAMNRHADELAQQRTGASVSQSAYDEVQARLDACRNELEVVSREHAALVRERGIEESSDLLRQLAAVTKERDALRAACKVMHDLAEAHINDGDCGDWMSIEAECRAALAPPAGMEGEGK